MTSSPALWRVALVRSAQFLTVPLLALLFVLLPVVQYGDAAIRRRPVRDPWWPLAKLLQCGALFTAAAAAFLGEETHPAAANRGAKETSHETRAAFVRHRQGLRPANAAQGRPSERLLRR